MATELTGAQKAALIWLKPGKRRAHWVDPGQAKNNAILPPSDTVPLASLRALVRRGFVVERREQSVRYFWLTEAGMMIRSDIVVEQKNRESLEHQKGRLGDAIDRARDA